MLEDVSEDPHPAGREEGWQVTAHSDYKLALELGPHEHQSPASGPAWGACKLCGLWKKSRVHRGQSAEIRRGEGRKRKEVAGKCVEISCPTCEGKGIVNVPVAELGSLLLRLTAKK